MEFLKRQREDDELKIKESTERTRRWERDIMRVDKENTYENFKNTVEKFISQHEEIEEDGYELLMNLVKFAEENV